MEEVVEKKEHKPVVLMSKKEKAAKIMAIIIFSLTFAALAVALIGDIIVLGRLILGFLAGLIAAGIVFFVGFFLMMISCILVFGVYILESYGFWPLTWAAEVFTAALKDNKLTPTQSSEIVLVRIILLAVCFVVFVTAIVVLALIKKPKRKKGEPRIKTPKHNKLTKSFGIVSLIMSILGVVATLGVLLIILIAG